MFNTLFPVFVEDIPLNVIFPKAFISVVPIEVALKRFEIKLPLDDIFVTPILLILASCPLLKLQFPVKFWSYKVFVPKSIIPDAFIFVVPTLKDNMFPCDIKVVPSEKELPVIEPDASILPTTSKACEGTCVPIPKYALDIDILSTASSLKSILPAEGPSPNHWLFAVWSLNAAPLVIDPTLVIVPDAEVPPTPDAVFHDSFPAPSVASTWFDNPSESGSTYILFPGAEFGALNPT